VVIFKNTLHHIDKEYQKEVLSNLKEIAKQLIVVDIDDPQHTTFRAKLWNNYYIYLLGDQGDNFLNFNEFRIILDSEKFFNCRVKTGLINTIKDNYFLCFDKRSVRFEYRLQFLYMACRAIKNPITVSRKSVT